MGRGKQFQKDKMYCILFEFSIFVQSRFISLGTLLQVSMLTDMVAKKLKLKQNHLALSNFIVVIFPYNLGKLQCALQKVQYSMQCKYN